eukprot:gene5311-5980_t
MVVNLTTNTVAISNQTNTTVRVAQGKVFVKASYFELSILGLLIVTILIGNTLVCLAFKSVSRRLKSITNSFVISLAASDILVGAFSLPLWAVFRMGYISQNSLPYFIYIGLDIVCGTASILNLTMISLERMYAVRFPATHRNIAHKRRVILGGIGFVWFFAFSLSGLAGLKIANVWSGYTYLVVIFAFVLPTIVIVASYMAIFHTMKCRQEQHWRFKQEIRVAIMIGIVIVLFLICWLPFFIFNIVFYHVCPCKPNHVLFPLIPIVKYMHYSNSLMNPIIYAYRYPDYRNAFKKMLFRCHCQKDDFYRQRTASVKSTMSSTMPSTLAAQYDHHGLTRFRDRASSSSQLRSQNKLRVIDKRERKNSPERCLLSPRQRASPQHLSPFTESTTV